jgi:hypothetical protein
MDDERLRLFVAVFSRAMISLSTERLIVIDFSDSVEDRCNEDTEGDLTVTHLVA